MAKLTKLKTNGGPVSPKAVLKKDTQVAPDRDGPLVTLTAGTPASKLSEVQLAQLHPDHFKEA
jgi:hypothetical protein